MNLNNYFKKKQMKYLIFVQIILILSGCSSLTDLSQNNYDILQLNENNYENLNGLYKNYEDTVFGKIIHSPSRGMDETKRKLLDRLFVSIPNEAYNKNIIVEFKFISKKEAIINAYQKDSLLFTKSINGKLKNGYFYVKPRVFIIPFFPIFYWHNFERVRISKSNNNLIVDHSLKMWGFALIAGGSDNGLTTSIYLKEEK